jgi:hypothetical protein
MSLKRAFKEVSSPTKNNPSNTIEITCVECPCDVSCATPNRSKSVDSYHRRASLTTACALNKVAAVTTPILLW